MPGTFHWYVDNSLDAYGETSPVFKEVRINRKLHKLDGKSLIHTLLHEELHILYPRRSERTIERMTDELLATISKAHKRRLYRYLKRGGRVNTPEWRAVQRKMR